MEKNKGSLRLGHFPWSGHFLHAPAHHPRFLPTARPATVVSPPSGTRRSVTFCSRAAQLPCSTVDWARASGAQNPLYTFLVDRVTARAIPPPAQRTCRL
jgi:hypothetical protein